MRTIPQCCSASRRCHRFADVPRLQPPCGLGRQTDACRQAFDERPAHRPLGETVHQRCARPRRIGSVKLLPIRIESLLKRMRPAEAVIRRDPGAFEVETGIESRSAHSVAARASGTKRFLDLAFQRQHGCDHSRRKAVTRAPRASRPRCAYQRSCALDVKPMPRGAVVEDRSMTTTISRAPDAISAKRMSSVIFPQNLHASSSGLRWMFGVETAGGGGVGRRGDGLSGTGPPQEDMPRMRKCGVQIPEAAGRRGIGRSARRVSPAAATRHRLGQRLGFGFRRYQFFCGAGVRPRRFQCRR